VAVIPLALQPYADQSRWVVWRRLKKKGSDEFTKVPFQARRPTLPAKSNDPSTWADAATAIKAAEDGDFNGIGICLLDSNIVAFDIDHCRNPKTKQIDPYALKLIERSGTYCEITPSETGLRIIGVGSGPRAAYKQKVPNSNGVTVETYRNCERYITVTGDALPNAPETLANIDSLVDEVVEELDAVKDKNKKKSNGAAKADDGGRDATASYRRP
jgi:primase-polymerase (primpol)-like protein